MCNANNIHHTHNTYKLGNVRISYFPKHGCVWVLAFYIFKSFSAQMATKIPSFWLFVLLMSAEQQQEQTTKKPLVPNKLGWARNESQSLNNKT
jgi:hypothetical protein